MQPGRVVIVSGFSGVGKGTVVKKMMKNHPGRYALSVSLTTRNKRPGEVHGVDYYFVTREEFQKRIEADDFAEYAPYGDHFYGSPKGFIEEQIAAGRDVILEIEVAGARQVRKLYPDALTVYIIPPSADALKERLVGRHTESPEEIRKRFNKAKVEADQVGEYRYVLINDTVEECAERLHGLVTGELQETGVTEEFIENLKQQIQTL